MSLDSNLFLPELFLLLSIVTFVTWLESRRIYNQATSSKQSNPTFNAQNTIDQLHIDASAREVKKRLEETAHKRRKIIKPQTAWCPDYGIPMVEDEKQDILREYYSMIESEELTTSLTSNLLPETIPSSFDTTFADDITYDMLHSDDEDACPRSPVAPLGMANLNPPTPSKPETPVVYDVITYDMLHSDDEDDQTSSHALPVSALEASNLNPPIPSKLETPVVYDVITNDMLHSDDEDDQSSSHALPVSALKTSNLNPPISSMPESPIANDVITYDMLHSDDEEAHTDVASPLHEHGANCTANSSENNTLCDRERQADIITLDESNTTIKEHLDLERYFQEQNVQPPLVKMTPITSPKPHPEIIDITESDTSCVGESIVNMESIPVSPHLSDMPILEAQSPLTVSPFSNIDISSSDSNLVDLDLILTPTLLKGSASLPIEAAFSDGDNDFNVDPAVSQAPATRPAITCITEPQQQRTTITTEPIGLGMKKHVNQKGNGRRLRRKGRVLDSSDNDEDEAPPIRRPKTRRVNRNGELTIEMQLKLRCFQCMGKGYEDPAELLQHFITKHRGVEIEARCSFANNCKFVSQCLEDTLMHYNSHINQSI